MPRCPRCKHRQDQHVARAGMRVCVLCDVGSEVGACAARVLQKEASENAPEVRAASSSGHQGVD